MTPEVTETQCFKKFIHIRQNFLQFSSCLMSGELASLVPAMAVLPYMSRNMNTTTSHEIDHPRSERIKPVC